MAEEESIGGDRSLNHFPDHLLLSILSFLPTLDAIRTASLSRKWRTLWSSLPSLNFDYSLFPPAAPTAAESPAAATRRRFANFVDRALILRPSHSPPLLKLRFQFDFKEHPYSSHVESWIRRAVRDGAAEIDVDFYINRFYHIGANTDYGDCSFEFNFSAVGNSRVRVLKICRCDLILPDIMSGVSFSSIQSLYLDQIPLSDEMVSDLILGCPNLESLVLEYCYNMVELKIASEKLKKLSLWYFHSQNEENESVEVCCPNLHSISIVCFEMGRYSISETPSLVEAYVEFMHEEKHYKYWSKVVRLLSGVEHLVVQNWWFRLKLRASEDLSSGKLVFNNLNSVELRTGYSKYDLLGITALLECSPNLQILTVDDLFKIDKDESLSEELLNSPISFSHPNLRQAKMKNYAPTQDKLNFLMLLMQQGVVLEKITVVSQMGGSGVLQIRP